MESLIVTFDPGETGREVVASGVEGVARAVFLPDLDGAARREAIAAGGAMLARNTDRELGDDETAHTGDLRLLQFVSAGIDFIALDRLPPRVPIAVNGGAYAEPMAEHALAMILAACKRLLVEHHNVARGEFNQFVPTRMFASMTAGILGLGGIGIATARLLRALGVRVHAINRSGRGGGEVDWIGTPDDLDEMLAGVDVLVLSLPLTRDSERMIGAPELARMKPDAILVNLARGEIVDEDAFYRHLLANPDFTACIDAWWVEPVRHGEFRMDRPFTSLPNVIASPHNSASVAGWTDVALARAVANCRRVLDGEAPLYLIGEEDRAPRDG